MFDQIFGQATPGKLPDWTVLMADVITAALVQP